MATKKVRPNPATAPEGGTTYPYANPNYTPVELGATESDFYGIMERLRKARLAGTEPMARVKVGHPDGSYTTEDHL